MKENDRTILVRSYDPRPHYHILPISCAPCGWMSTTVEGNGIMQISNPRLDHLLLAFKASVSPAVGPGRWRGTTVLQ